MSGADLRGFLLLPGIVGGSTQPGHAGEIEVLSFTWVLGKSPGGGTTPPAGSGPGLQILAQAGSVGGPMELACASAMQLGTAVFSVLSPDGKKDLLRIRLVGCQVSSVGTRGDTLASEIPLGAEPVIEVGLRFKQTSVEVLTA